MPKAEMELHKPQGDWRKVNASTQPGIWEQTLSADARTGDKTVIQRYDARAATADGVIVHDYWEEVLVLSGVLTDLTLGESFSAGMYACRPPGMPHGPYRSANGCRIVVVIRTQAFASRQACSP